jgi:hypothetical protein
MLRYMQNTQLGEFHVAFVVIQDKNNCVKGETEHTILVETSERNVPKQCD